MLDECWPHCRVCSRPKELLGYPADFWFCKRCDVPRNAIADKDILRYSKLWSAKQARNSPTPTTRYLK